MSYTLLTKSCFQQEKLDAKLWTKENNVKLKMDTTGSSLGNHSYTKVQKSEYVQVYSLTIELASHGFSRTILDAYCIA